MKVSTRSYLILHLCVFIWGFTAILGKLMSLEALPLVWWRVALSSIILFFVVGRSSRALPSRASILRLMGIGALIGMHWLSFYQAVKWSNASIGVAAFGTVSFFSAMVEPLVFGRRFVWYELLLGLFIIPGIWLISGDLDIQMQKGLAVGIFSAFLGALFTALNKREVDTHAHAPFTMTFYEMVGATAAASLALLLVQYDVKAMIPQPLDWLWLLILVVVCTLLTNYLVLGIMRHVTAFTVNLVTNLEPIYGIALAILIFREDRELPSNFYLGAALILSAVLSHPFLKKKFDRAQPVQNEAV